MRTLIAIVLSLTVTGVSGFQINTCSVKEGDSVTLFSNAERTQDMTIKWYFNGSRIAQLSEDPRKTCTDVHCKETNGRFQDRLKLDNQSGSLTITNTSTSHSGLYELIITSNSSSTDKTFSVSVDGVHEVETMSVMEGKPFTLQPSEARKSGDVMVWLFDDTPIAEIPQVSSRSCADDQCEVRRARFRDRLKLDNQTGSLTITNTRTEDSGEYTLKITSSRIDSIRHRRSIRVTSEKPFSVKVTALPGSGLSPGAIFGIIIGAVFLPAVVFGVIVYRRRQNANDAQHNQNEAGVSYQSVIC